MRFRSLMKMSSAAVLVMLLLPTIARSESTTCPRDDFGTIKRGTSSEVLCRNCWYLPCLADCESKVGRGSKFCETNCQRVYQGCKARH